MPGCKSSTPIKPPIPSSHIKDSTTVSIELILLADSSYLLSIRWLISLESEICFDISVMIEDTWSMLSTNWILDCSTSFIAVSMIWIFSSNCAVSSDILEMLAPAVVTLSRVMRINDNVSSIVCIILVEVSSRCIKDWLILLEEAFVPVLRVRICSATTANPLPASPARAASIDAFNANRLVWLEISSIVPVSSFTIAKSFLKSCKVISISCDSAAILFVVSTRLSRSLELTSVCLPEVAVSRTIFSIK